MLKKPLDLIVRLQQQLRPCAQEGHVPPRTVGGGAGAKHRALAVPMCSSSWFYLHCAPPFYEYLVPATLSQPPLLLYFQ